MSAHEDEAVSLCLITRDNDRAADFIDGLAKEGLDNDVHRMESSTHLYAYIETRIQAEPFLIVMDMRAPNIESRSILKEIERRYVSTLPVVIVIADRDDETAALEPHKNMVAGRISSYEPAQDFIRLIDSALSSNWSLKTV